jgi:hypothetical protein
MVAKKLLLELHTKKIAPNVVPRSHLHWDCQKEYFDAS